MGDRGELATTAGIESHATPDMCAFCFDCLLAALLRRSAPALPKFATHGRFPLFVTFENDVEPDGTRVLRGCIGCLSPIELSELRHYAHSAAFLDERFAPMGLNDLTPKRGSTLFCKVSLLHDYQQARSAFDFELGTHGIIIDFDVGGDSAAVQHFNATFLPEIAPEQGWNKQQTVLNLVRKSGFTGLIDENLLGCIRLTTYRSSRCRLSYPEYYALRCRPNCQPLAPQPLLVDT